MTDTPPPIDDEVVSAVLDGEATAAERALVEGSPEGRARLEELRRAAASVAAPVEPLDEPTADVLIARAVAGARSGAAPGSDDLADRRARRGALTRRALGAVAAVAAVVLVAVGIASLGGGDAERADSGASTETAAPEAGVASDALAGAEASVPDLRSGADPDELLTRLSTLVASGATFDHMFDDTDRSDPASGGASAEATPSSACTAPVPAVPATSGWRVVAVGRLPTGPVVLVSDGPPAPGGRALVLDASSCEVLGEGAI